VARAIADALDAGSVLLVAGAGYGKTMALEEAITLAERRSVWLSCAEAGGEAGRLLLEAVDRLRAAVPGLADVVGDRLVAGAEPLDARAAARAVLEELERLLVEPLVIVFDDAEEIVGSEASLAWIAQLLGIQRAPLSVAVASRRPLPIRLAKLRAPGRLREFGPAELGFTAGECEQALRLRGRRPSREDVDAVMAATEGWPLGVVLAGLAESEEAASGSVPRDELFRYLAEEVLDRLDANARAALIDSSVPAVLTPAVGRDLRVAPDFVEEIAGLGLFLRPHPSGHGARAFHPLFREFLLERLREERSEAERQALHAQAAETLARAGRIADAVEHWLEAGRWEDALSTLSSQGPDLLRTAPGAVRGWLSRLPAEFHRMPSYLLLEGQLEWGAGRHEEALPPLRAAVSVFGEEGDVEHEWLARWFLADALLSAGAFDEMLELADGWEEPRVRQAGTSALGVAWYKVVALAARGQSDEAEELASVLRSDAEAGVQFRYLDGMALTAADLPAGRGQASFERLRSTIRGLELHDPQGRLPYALAAIIWVCLDLGDRRAAFEWLERCQQESERVGLGFVARDVHLQRAFLLAQQGRLSSAELELGLAGPRQGTGWRGVNRHKAEAQVAAARGDVAEAEAAAERALARVASGPICFRVWAALDMAPVLAESGAPALARRAIGEALSTLDASFPGSSGAFHRARLLAVRAWLEYEGGEADAAYQSVSRCWQEAGDSAGQVVRAHWPSVGRLLWRALANGVIDPDAVLPVLETAFPGGEALVVMTDHPLPAVRRRALSAALASSHPAVLSQLTELVHDPDDHVASAAAATEERVRNNPPALRFELFGRFRVLRAGWELDAASWERPMAPRVARYLLVQGSSAVSEDALFEAFWSDRPPDVARKHLAVALSRARRVLDLPGAERSVIEASERTYRLRLRDHDTVDAYEFEQAATAALAEGGPSRLASLERADTLWTGEPLPEDRYADWSMAWRERLVERYVQVLNALVDAYDASGDDHDAVRAARKLLALDPLNERTHRKLMAAYSRTGRTSHALRQYLECRHALVGALGVEPSAATSRLQARILAGETI
jgi:ATP/maltotriose-dependent transcriptional regulator MalT/DNA-binding SARP family transcriptional activator